MDYQIMGKRYKIDHNRKIGTVLFVVEGGNENGGAELRLIRKIFADILGFEMHELRRGTEYENNNVFKECEVEKESNVQKMHIANADRPVQFYSLEVSFGWQLVTAVAKRKQ